MAEQVTNDDGAELSLEGYAPLQEFACQAVYPAPGEGLAIGRRLARQKAESLAAQAKQLAAEAAELLNRANELDEQAKEQET